MKVKQAYNFVIDAVTGAVEYVGGKSRSAVAVVGGAAAAVGAGMAHAVESAYATEAKTAVTNTQSDMVLVFGGVLTMAIAIWGIYKIVKIFGGK